MENEKGKKEGKKEGKEGGILLFHFIDVQSL